MESKILDINNISTTLVKVDKFKSTKIQIHFLGPMNEKITSRSLLPYLMKSITKKYNTRIALQKELENMYNLKFNVGLSKVGKSHIITFDFSIIDNPYTLNNENLFEKTILFLKEVLYNPLFKESIFIEEKRLLEEYFDSIYTDKMKYASIKLNETMFENELYKFSSLGNESDIKNLTLSDCENEYLKMMATNKIYLNIIGNIDFDNVTAIIEDNLNFSTQDKLVNVIDDQEIDFSHKSVEETQELLQSKLIIGYRNKTFINTKKYYPMIVFNSIFGASSESLLFSRIREDLGKVYFISSNYDPYKGVLFIYSGINKEDKDIVIKEIDKVLKNIINEKISDELINTHKELILTSLYSSLDSLGAISSRFFRALLLDKKVDVELIKKNILNVTKKDISEAAKTLIKDTTFFLRGEDNDY